VKFASLEAAISQLRSGITEAAATASGGGGLVPVIIPVTTTDSNGKTVTSSFTTSGVPKTGLVNILPAFPIHPTGSCYAVPVVLYARSR
jgi:hypothetical protein